MRRIYISSSPLGEQERLQVTAGLRRRALKMGVAVIDPASPARQHALRESYERDRWSGPYGTPVKETITFERYALLRHLMDLSTCDTLYLIPEWRHSAAARTELAAARAMGVKVMTIQKDGRTLCLENDGKETKGGEP